MAHHYSRRTGSVFTERLSAVEKKALTAEGAEETDICGGYFFRGRGREAGRIVGVTSVAMASIGSP